MEAEGRRVRRFRVRRNTLLPLHTCSYRLSNTISCWYCDYKICALNEPLFCFGQRHARFLKLWFSIGIGFGLSALLGVTMILLWDVCYGHTDFGNISRALFFGFPPSFLCTNLGTQLLLQGTFQMGSSEGIQIEYIAIFIAVLFPGALVAFNYELLQTLPKFNALRVYCAGIWHNAVCCAACGLTLFLLPLVLFPFYIHGSPMVLDVPHTSPLSGYLSPGDVIHSVDGVPIENELSGREGYCIPSSLLEESKKVAIVENKYDCPKDLTAFVNIPCFATSRTDDGDNETGDQNRKSMYCLNAKDIVKLSKCDKGWGEAKIDGSSGCRCTQNESCLAPAQMPGLVWVEITYSRPSHKCLLPGTNGFTGPAISDSMEQECGGTFIFVGDVISMAHSIQLTSYKPRWALHSVAHLPNILERILIWHIPGLSSPRSSQQFASIFFGWRISFGCHSMPH
ncbi:Membrane-bound transcription factor site-2 protease [Quillaja saponaria]|uniref:Membrane-bound transcription factor site-2 protease n=1 Tax=Quillaja saponaria TaxID=32244 RepID=A0AAD7PVH4_QUISA|nr:Membrane-bound transcription factor site-2 protease [Quillaja saponaria]